MNNTRKMKILDRLTFAVIVIGVLYFGIHFLVFVLRR
jgi:hypothetical protein